MIIIDKSAVFIIAKTFVLIGRSLKYQKSMAGVMILAIVMNISNGQRCCFQNGNGNDKAT
jgi:hypothetical protein